MAALAGIFVAHTGERGIQIAQNATVLDAAMDDSQVTFSLRDNPFSPSDDLIIQNEQVLLGTYPAITREQNSTTGAEHSNGSNVLLKGGTTLKSHTFDGSESISAIRCSGSVEAWYGIIEGTTVRYIAKSDADRLEIFFPIIQITPDNNDILKVVVWNFYPELDDEDGKMFWAVMYK
ncbi:hypothetical protein LCGC14_1861740 [marine sediment metagenome]|uniref:Uncharacterized protein n=1 Tax=marine sediment metagenome TaxID=412755 RepID=A0A0F9ILQ2_9ZZZZ